MKTVDSEQVADVDQVHNAIIDGEIMELLDKYDEIDLSGFKSASSNREKPQGWDIDEMNAMFERYAIADPHDLGVNNNGLLLVQAQIVELIQMDIWNHPNIKRNFDHWDLEVESDW